MKLINNILIGLLLSGLFFTSCEEFKIGDDFVSQQPEEIVVNQDTIFSKKLYADQVLVKAYTSLPYPIATAQKARFGGDFTDALTSLSYSACHYGGARSQYYVGSYSAGTVNSNSVFYYNTASIWMGLRYSWLVIENIDKVPDMLESEKLHAKAEARMIIATQCANLLRNFGGFPLIDHSISADETFHYPRATFEESVNFIVKLIDESIPDLPWKETADNDGRMTKAYAMGLKLRVLLFAASPLFNDAEPYLAGEASDKHLTWYGNYDKSRWSDAEQAGKDFIDELEKAGGYSLVQADTKDMDGYRAAFNKAYFTRNNGEVLLSIRKAYRNLYSKAFCGGADNYAHAQSPTLTYANMFSFADGSDFPSDFDWENAPTDPFANRDPRFYETILTNGRAYKNRKSELYVTGRDRPTDATNGTGLLMYKFSQDYTSATSIGAVDSWPEMRLSEVYLSYAEAINEANDGPNTTAYDMINKVRNRVGLPNLSAGLSQEEFRKAVLRERALEFGYEEVRWYDVIRWKMKESFMSDIQGVNMYIDSSKPTGYRYELFTITPSRVWKNDWSAKWYLSAFPINEINKNYGLIQNPGW